MSSAVELYPGAEAFLRENRNKYRPQDQSFIDSYVAEKRDAYQAKLMEFEIKYALRQITGPAHIEENRKRLDVINSLLKADKFENIPGTNSHVTNFLYAYEKKMIADDNAQIENLTNPEIEKFHRQSQTGLFPTEHTIEHIVLGADDRPVTPQTRGFQPTGPSPLESSPSTPPARATHIRQPSTRGPAEDISYREVTRDGAVTEVIDVNSLAAQSVRKVIDSLETQAPKPTTFPATQFTSAEAQPSDSIASALQKMNAGPYIIAAQRQLRNASAEERKDFVQETLEPDRLFVLSQMEKTDKDSSKFAVLKTLDSFLKIQIGRINPVANPVFDTETAEVAPAPQVNSVAEAPQSEKAFIVAPSRLPDVTEDMLIQRARVLHIAIQDRNGAKLNSFIEQTLLPEKATMDNLLAARRHMGHSSTPLLEIHTAQLAKLVTIAENKMRGIPTLTLKPVSATIPASAPQSETVTAAKTNAGSIMTQDNKDIMEIVKSGTSEQRFILRNRLIVDHEDIFKKLQENKNNGVSFEENRILVDQLSFLRRQMSDLKTHLEIAYQASKAAERQERAVKATDEQKEISFLKPEKKSFFSRMREGAASLVENVKDTFSKFTKNEKVRTAVAGGGLALGVVVAVAGISKLAGDPATDPLVSKNTPEASVKSEPLPLTTNAFTVIVPPDAKPAAPAVTAEAPAAKVDTPAPILKVVAPAKTARADFSAKAVEKSAPTYVMPDELKVTFNDGSTSRFGKDTWENAYKQIGQPFDLSKPAPANG